MVLTMLGATTGESTVRVTAVGVPKNVTIHGPDDTTSEDDTAYRFANVTVLNRSITPGQKGDSGAPVVWLDDDGNYRMCCINFASIPSVPDGARINGFAVPASVAEYRLGIRFGVRAPTAVPKYRVGNVVRPQVVHPGETVTLDGSGSEVKESGAGPLTYQWRWLGPLDQLESLGLTIQGSNQQNASFLAPSGARILSFRLVVTDNNGAKASDTVEVTVVNRPPTAVPGYNQAVPVGSPVTLAGGAEDPDQGHVDDMDYEWSLVEVSSSSTRSGARSASPGNTPSSTVILATPTENGVEVPNKRTFTPTQTGAYVFTLTVTDPGLLTHAANVTIHACSATGTSQWYDTGETRENPVTLVVEKRQTRVHNGETYFQWVIVVPNHPPVAFAGYNDIVLPNTTVYLRGSSKDPDRHLATEMDYNWSLVEDVTETPGRSTTRVPQVTPLITIASPTSRRTSFTAPAQAQTLRIRLTVTDPNGATDTDDVITQVHSGVGTTEWLDTRATRGCGATRDKEQMRRIDRRPHGEYRWTADPEDEVWSAWEDTDQTRNRNEGDWTDTDPLETMGTPPDVQKKQTRTITWEQEQTRTSETCGTIEPQWLEASETETRWVPVTPPPPAGVPPKPTNDQWNVRRSTDGIYANVASLPTVSPAISEVQVRLQIDTTTVTATLGTTLDNSYAKVLADDSSNWQTGVWSVAIRFRNNNGYGPYSDAKIVLVAIWEPTERTRNRTETDWVDTGRTQTDPVEDFDEKEQRRLVTYEQEEELRPNPDNEPNRWVLIREFEYQWVPIQDPPPPPLPPPSNVTASATHNSVTVSWDTVQGATGYVLQLGEPGRKTKR